MSQLEESATARANTGTRETRESGQSGPRLSPCIPRIGAAWDASAADERPGKLPGRPFAPALIGCIAHANERPRKTKHMAYSRPSTNETE